MIELCEYCNSHISNDLESKVQNESKEKVDACLLVDDEGAGLIIFYNNAAVRLIDINYCPMCGRKIERID